MSTKIDNAINIDSEFISIVSLTSVERIFFTLSNISLLAHSNPDSATINNAIFISFFLKLVESTGFEPVKPRKLFISKGLALLPSASIQFRQLSITSLS